MFEYCNLGFSTVSALSLSSCCEWQVEKLRLLFFTRSPLNVKLFAPVFGKYRYLGVTESTSVAVSVGPRTLL